MSAGDTVKTIYLDLQKEANFCYSFQCCVADVWAVNVVLWVCRLSMLRCGCVGCQCCVAGVWAIITIMQRDL